MARPPRVLCGLREPLCAPKEQGQVFVAGEAPPLLDGLELKQEVVAESPPQPQSRILFAAELLRQCPQNRECRWLFAAFLLGEQAGKMLQPPRQYFAFKAEIVPVRMSGPQAGAHACDLNPPRVKLAAFHSPVVRYDLKP